MRNSIRRSMWFCIPWCSMNTRCFLSDSNSGPEKESERKRVDVSIQRRLGTNNQRAEEREASSAP